MCDFYVAIDADNICSLYKHYPNMKQDYNGSALLARKVDLCVNQVYQYLKRKYISSGSTSKVYFSVYHSASYDYKDYSTKANYTKLEKVINEIFTYQRYSGRFIFIPSKRKEACDTAIEEDLARLANVNVILVTSDFKKNFQDCVTKMLDNGCQVEVIYRMANRSYAKFSDRVKFSDWFVVEDPSNEKLLLNFIKCLHSDRFVNILLHTSNYDLQFFTKTTSERTKVMWLVKQFNQNMQAGKICNSAEKMALYSRLADLVMMRIKDKPVVLYNGQEYSIKTVNGYIKINQKVEGVQIGN